MLVMSVALVGTIGVAAFVKAPSQSTTKSVPSFYQAGQNFLAMARNTEGYSAVMSDDDCSEIETALDDCFDDSSDVVSGVR